MRKSIPTSQKGIQTTQRPAGEQKPATREESRFLIPPVDIFETGEGLMVVVDMPGVEKKNITVDVDEDILTISGKAGYTPPKNAIYDEFQLASYHRAFQLTDRVDRENISAELKNGVLTILLPKAEKAKPKQIQVKVGS